MIVSYFSSHNRIVLQFFSEHRYSRLLPQNYPVLSRLTPQIYPNYNIIAQITMSQNSTTSTIIDPHFFMTRAKTKTALRGLPSPKRSPGSMSHMFTDFRPLAVTPATSEGSGIPSRESSRIYKAGFSDRMRVGRSKSKYRKPNTDSEPVVDRSDWHVATGRNSSYELLGAIRGWDPAVHCRKRKWEESEEDHRPVKRVMIMPPSSPHQSTHHGAGTPVASSTSSASKPSRISARRDRHMADLPDSIRAPPCEVTAEEILTYNPKWSQMYPAATMRLVENGWSQNKFAGYINYARHRVWDHACRLNTYNGLIERAAKEFHQVDEWQWKMAQQTFQKRRDLSTASWQATRGLQQNDVSSQTLRKALYTIPQCRTASMSYPGASRTY